ncbi:MAG: hypothetical protein ACT4P7_10115 [Gemmatimonadaceae bacterium]
MRRSVDFSNARRNPFAAKLKRSIAIRLDTFTIDYFKGLAAETDLPYQTVIDLYLRDCAGAGRRTALDWRLTKRGAAQQCVAADERGTWGSVRCETRPRARGGGGLRSAHDTVPAGVRGQRD